MPFVHYCMAFLGLKKELSENQHKISVYMLLKFETVSVKNDIIITSYNGVIFLGTPCTFDNG